MKCARRPAGALKPASSTAAGSPRPDPRFGRLRARLSGLFPALALLLCGLHLIAAAPATAQTVTAPGKPQNVTVTPGDGKLTLTWDAPSSWGTWPAAGYYIEWKLSSQSGWGFVAGTGANHGTLSSSATRFEFTGRQLDAPNVAWTVTNGVAYDLRIVAYSKEAGTDNSRDSGWVTVSDNRPRGPADTVWKATLTPADYGGGTLGCVFQAPCDSALSDNSFTVGGTEFGFTYITYTSINGQLVVSVSPNRNAALGALKFCSGSVGIPMSGGAQGSQVINQSGVPDLGWATGTPVEIRIGSACADVVSPSAVRDMSLGVGDGAISVSWSAPSQGVASNFEVEWKEQSASDVRARTANDPGTGWVRKVVGVLVNLEHSTLIRNLVNGTPYDVRVRAGNAAGHGPWTAGTGTPQAADTTGPAAPAFSPRGGTRVRDAGTNITLTFAEAIKADNANTDFTDSSVDAILTLKTSDAGGTDIAFDASIDGTMRVITIDPTSDLPVGAVYVAVSNGYYDANGNRGTAASATFTVDTTSGGTPPGGGGGGAGGGAGTPPAVSLSASPNPMVTEGSAVTVTATLSRALSDGVTIPLAVRRDTSEPGDHGTLSSIAVAAGETSGTGTIATHRDADPHDETFTVSLGTLPSQVTAGSPASVTVRIDDDAVAGAPPAPEVAFFPAASRALGGMVRVVNMSDEAGTVTVRAIDDAGEEYPAQRLALGAGEATGFSPADLEGGNADKGLSGTGAGAGDWRLVFESDLDLRVLGLVRPPGGGLSPVHDTAPGSAKGGYEVVFFNPASNRGLRSRLRLVNRSGSPAAVTIAGTDAAGQAGESAVTLRIPAQATCTLSATVLESGAWGDDEPAAGCEALAGALGDGAGKWRLMVTSDQPLAVMSLLASAAGRLTNLSSVPVRAEAGVHRLALLPPADDLSSQGFVRLVNRDTRAGTVRLRAFDDAGEEYPAQTLALTAGQGMGFTAADLEAGHEARGLTGTGDGAGRWRLVLEPEPADLDLQALSLVRNPGSSSLAALHDTAPGSPEEGWHVAFFNPASNRGLVSRLRLVNRSGSPAAVTIAGTDAAGQAGESAVTVRIPAQAACALSAPVLESGTWGDTGPAAGCEALTGALGDGAGKWRLTVSSDQPLAVMSLLRHSASGSLANLSTARE